MVIGSGRASPEEVRKALDSLIHEMLDASLPDGGTDDPEAASATNLSHHRVLRRADLRLLQRSLARLGLSSLGRAQVWTLGAIAASARAAGALADPPISGPRIEGAIDMDRGRSLLDDRSDALFGPRPTDRVVRVMVTMPEREQLDDAFIAGCLDFGMNAARIATARGDAEDWRAIAARVSAIAEERGQPCRVFADLSGPKIRISAIEKRGKSRGAIRLEKGDRCILAGPDSPDTAEHEHPRLTLDAAGLAVRPGVGDSVWFDDGKAGSVVEAVSDDDLTLRITHAKPGGQRLRTGKGVNFPDTTIRGPVLTARDRAAIDELGHRVDGFIVSFVRGPRDIEEARRVLSELGPRDGRPPPGIIAKIETRAAFENLYEILRELLRLPRAGIMIARGDLAVECGFERMAELQTEILDCCEAAHLPVVWATEVLASLAKRGRASRAEISDVVFAQQAECVMLNKGPEILSAMRTLVDILRRMQGHQRKKAPMLRPLAIAGAGR